MAVKLGIHSLPASFLIDREGKVMAIDVPGPQLAEHLERLLSDKPATPEPPKGADPPRS